MIAVVRDKDCVLIGLFSTENLDAAQELARENSAHSYFPREGYDLENKIGQEVEFGYHWKFGRDD